MCRKLPFHVPIVLLLAAAGTGCTGLSLPSLEEVGADEAPPGSAIQAMLIPSGRVVGSPTEVYTRVARGVLTCYFGADGPLKANYIYHAQAEPASKGGNSRIRIMTRDHEASDPRALRAYLIEIGPGDGGVTKVEVENRRLSEPQAASLKQDVERWSTGEEGCGEGPVTAGWQAEPGAQTNEENGKKGKSP